MLCHCGYTQLLQQLANAVVVKVAWQEDGIACQLSSCTSRISAIKGIVPMASTCSMPSVQHAEDTLEH